MSGLQMLSDRTHDALSLSLSYGICTALTILARYILSLQRATLAPELRESSRLADPTIAGYT